MTENDVVEVAESIGAHQDNSGRWVFDDEEHMVDFALEIIQLERDKICEKIRDEIEDLING